MFSKSLHHFIVELSWVAYCTVYALYLRLGDDVRTYMTLTSQAPRLSAQHAFMKHLGNICNKLLKHSTKELRSKYILVYVYTYVPVTVYVESKLCNPLPKLHTASSYSKSQAHEIPSLWDTFWFKSVCYVFNCTLSMLYIYCIIYVRPHYSSYYFDDVIACVQLLSCMQNYHSWTWTFLLECVSPSSVIHIKSWECPAQRQLFSIPKARYVRV